LWAGISVRRMWRWRRDEAELGRPEDCDLQARDARKAANVEGGDLVAVCKRGGGDDEVVGADRLASAPQVRRGASVDASGREVKRKDGEAGESALDEDGPLLAAGAGLGLVDAGKELARGQRGERSLVVGQQGGNLVGSDLPSLDGDEDAGV
jgi:hypothetical protein